MKRRDESGGGATSGPLHLPVLVAEVLDLLRAPAGRVLSGWLVDATVGLGGHAEAILREFPGLRILGQDQDPEALALAAQRLQGAGDRVVLRRGRFSQLPDTLDELGIERPVAMLLDLGASSLQFDDAARGFSLQADGPLDMRMDPTRERTAADVVNTWDESDLADLFYYEGDERESRRIARAIVESRARAPFRRTLALAELVERTLRRGPRGASPGRIHPATRVFQALRRAVNEEGEELLAALGCAEERLAEGGRLLAISFHSGEDRCVKRYLAEGAREGRWDLLTRKPVRAGRDEVRANRRARSASLRAAARTRGEAAGGAA